MDTSVSVNGDFSFYIYSFIKIFNQNTIYDSDPKVWFYFMHFSDALYTSLTPLQLSEHDLSIISAKS
jgi:hypothetical protein